MRCSAETQNGRSINGPLGTDKIKDYMRLFYFLKVNTYQELHQSGK